MRRTLVLLVLVLVAGSAAGLFVAARSTGPQREPPPVVVDFTPSEVSRLVVVNGKRRAELVRSGDGAWEAQPGTSPQSAILLFNLEDSFLPMRAYRGVEADPAEAQFGLSDPTLVLSVTGRGGARRVVAIGGPSFTGAGHYAARLGDAGTGSPRLYLVPRGAVDALRSVAMGVPVRPTDALAERIADVEVEEDEAAEETRIGPYLRQALDAGVSMPVGLE